MPGRATDWGPWALGVGGVLVYDAALIRAGTDSLSARAGRHPVVTLALLCALSCHLLGHPRALARLDPLAAIARRITPR